MTCITLVEYFQYLHLCIFFLKKEIVKEALTEERKRSEKAIEEAVKRTREELMEYIKEQKRVSCQWLMGFISCGEKLVEFINPETCLKMHKTTESGVVWFLSLFFSNNLLL